MTPDDPTKDPWRAEFDRRRKGRAIMTALILGGMVALFYFITLARIGANVS